MSPRLGTLSPTAYTLSAVRPISLAVTAAVSGPLPNASMVAACWMSLPSPVPFRDGDIV